MYWMLSGGLGTGLGATFEAFSALPKSAPLLALLLTDESPARLKRPPRASTSAWDVLVSCIICRFLTARERERESE
jgi:hypothetical protein